MIFSKARSSEKNKNLLMLLFYQKTALDIRRQTVEKILRSLTGRDNVLDPADLAVLQHNFYAVGMKRRVG